MNLLFISHEKLYLVSQLTCFYMFDKNFLNANQFIISLTTSWIYSRFWLSAIYFWLRVLSRLLDCTFLLTSWLLTKSSVSFNSLALLFLWRLRVVTIIFLMLLSIWYPRFYYRYSGKMNLPAPLLLFSSFIWFTNTFTIYSSLFVAFSSQISPVYLFLIDFFDFKTSYFSASLFSFFSIHTF